MESDPTTGEWKKKGKSIWTDQHTVVQKFFDKRTVRMAPVLLSGKWQQKWQCAGNRFLISTILSLENPKRGNKLVKEIVISIKAKGSVKMEARCFAITSHKTVRSQKCTAAICCLANKVTLALYQFLCRMLKVSSSQQTVKFWVTIFFCQL